MKIHVRLLATAAALTGILAACGGGDSTGPRGVAPTMASVTPSQGTVGTELTITGTDFRSGATVQVGSAAATGVEVSSLTTIYATVPAGVTAGQAYDVIVRNGDGTEVRRTGAFTAVAPNLLYVNGATKPSGNVGSTVRDPLAVRRPLRIQLARTGVGRDAAGLLRLDVDDKNAVRRTQLAVGICDASSIR